MSNNKIGALDCTQPFKVNSVNDGFVDFSTAIQRYTDRINPANGVGGFLISLENLKKMVAELEVYNQGKEPTDDTRVDFVRVWKGRNIQYGWCGNNEDPTVHLEDIILVPTLRTGEDLYANSSEPLIIVHDEDGNPQMRPLILSSSRPCPDWCKNILPYYFHERVLPNPILRTPNMLEPYNGIDPYDNACGEG